MCELFGGEGGSATATALGVGVGKLPAAFEQVFGGVVEFHAFEEAGALAIYEDGQATDGKDMVALGRHLFEAQ